MIKLSEASILNNLPETMATEPETIALAYAVQRQIAKILRAADGIRVWSNVDGLDHAPLDMLAAELRTPNYSETYTLAVKRTLVKNAIKYYMKAGTSGAVEEMVTAIFSNGNVVEWYSYDGQHHHFRVTTTNPTISGETAEEFSRVVQTVKRKSTIFDGVIVTVSTPAMDGRTAFGLWMTDAITFLPAIM